MTISFYGIRDGGFEFGRMIVNAIRSGFLEVRWEDMLQYLIDSNERFHDFVSYGSHLASLLILVIIVQEDDLFGVFDIIESLI